MLAAAAVVPGNAGAAAGAVEDEAGVEARAAGRAGTEGAVGVSVGAAAGVGAGGGEDIAALGAETAPLRSQGFGGDGIIYICAITEWNHRIVNDERKREREKSSDPTHYR